MTPGTARGAGVGYGAGIGLAVHVPPAPVAPEHEAAEDIETATARIHDAFDQVARALTDRAAHATGPLAETLAAAATMAADPALTDQTVRQAGAGFGPATAVTRAVESFATTFQEAGGYLAERVTDLVSVRDRVVALLLGQDEPGMPALIGRSVIIAADLAPADTAALDLDLIAGIVTAAGGPTSHTAIIARQLGIPCVVGAAAALQLPAGARILVDAASGTVVADPDEERVALALRRARRLAEVAEDDRPAATSDGHRIQLLANIGTPEDALRAASTAVDGVGLFRTEMLYLDRAAAPSSAEQVGVYRQVLDAFDGRKVVLRTLDAGADKPLTFATADGEANPALGLRGYRTARRHPELLEDQLAAIAEAATDHPSPVWVMAPMISTAGEAAEFAARARSHGITTVGAMVEVPSAALLADELLAPLDFLSLGTNDLTQYVMAADRLSTDLADLTDRWQPAVLRLVAATVRAGKTAGKPVGVCGESAADPLMALVLTGLGISSLSMSAPSVGGVRYALRAHDLRACRRMAEAALAAPDAAAARSAAAALLDETVRETLHV
ncbi:phosphoenolpyruvate--protein phosphotransferase [Ruania zhangjianzhongii]|uniref:phosphoenolpyruvate--protein phosphotransferase n=1 Tax=Ruania zhangjianzhongii TaxID=2603206 RepID=UPI0011C8FBFB|nr:phosphoenolpyruvate--protein phosphotransferase [Ruania zhangjianzhongii]